MPTITGRPARTSSGVVVTPGSELLRPSEADELYDAVDSHFGDDSPRECYRLALEFFDDALRHGRLLRAVDGYRYPLDRRAVLDEAIRAIRAC